MAVKDSESRKRKSIEEQRTTPSKKKRVEFCVASFQKRLQKEDSFSALEEFVKLCRDAKGSSDPAVQFLRKGGHLSEILYILDGGRCRDLARVAVVFSALHSLLLRVLSKVPEQRRNAEEMCHHLLSNHLNVIHSLLNAKNARYRKAVLQLLTAVVTLSTVLARDVLSYVSLSTEVVDDIAQPAKPDDPQSVRTCYIQFLMAFLIEGSPSVIRLLLDKRYTLTTIVRGLEYDSFNLVIFVLTTLRTKVVEVMEIPKTQKLHTFNTRIMCWLLKLYKWKGPAAFVQKWKRDSKERDLDVLIDPHQQQKVAEAVHDLLLSLCTSYRHGIAFHDHTLGSSGLRLNALVASVLKELQQPWEHTLQTELVARTVAACPDLSRVVHFKVAPVLSPRPSLSWIKAVNFVTQVIASMKLSELSSLEPGAALNTIKVLIAPVQLIIPLASPGLSHQHPAVCQKAAEFLQTVLRTMAVAQSVLVGQQAADLQRYVLELFPNGIVLEKAWTRAVTDSTTDKIPSESAIALPTPAQLMLTLVELMFLYQEHYPLLLNAGNAQSVLTTSLVNALDLKDSSDDNVLPLQVKVLQLLALWDTSVLEPGKERFSNAVAILLQASCKDDALSTQAQHALGVLLLKSRILEKAAVDVTGELGIWLNSCRIVPPSHRRSVISFLHDVLNTVTTNPTPYVEQVSKIQEEIFPPVRGRKLKNIVHKSIADQLFQELLSIVDNEKSGVLKTSHKTSVKEENSQGRHDFDDLTNTVELSALLMCVIEVVESKKNLEAPVEKYLSYVLVHLLHMQCDPKPFLSLVGRWKCLPSAVAEYLNSWSGEQPVVLTKPFGSCSPETSLSHLLLKSNRTVPELEDCSNPLTIILLVRLVTFHIVQLTEKQLLTEQTIIDSLSVFVALQHALQQTTSTADSSLAYKYSVKFFNIILKHPLLLCYFSPLHHKKRITEKHVTNLLLDFLEKTDIFKMPIKNSACILLKEKFMRNVVHYLEKSEHTPSGTETLLKAVKSLTLTVPEMNNLVSKLSRKMTITPWTELLAYLLGTTCMLPSAEVTTLSLHLVEHLESETDENAVVWNIVDAFQDYLQRFPHCVHWVPSSLFPVTACKRGVKLASVLLRHQSSCVSQLTALVETKTKKNTILVTPEVLCPLLSTACHHGPLPKSLLKTVYEQYKTDILAAMEVPISESTCFTDHPDIARQLIIGYMDSCECHGLCRSLDMNWKTLGLCSHFHLSVIHGLQTLGGWRKVAGALVHLLLHQLKQMLQQKAPSFLINQTCSLLAEHLDDNNIKWSNQEIQPDEEWNALPALILQVGLSGSDLVLTHNLFLALTRVMWRANAIKMAERIFEMTVSHSRFLDIVLVQERGGFKLSVLQLVLTCYQLAPHVMKPTHVPIWLGAYGATLSHSNQVILKILLTLQKNRSVNLSAYRPFLWGDAAINHYSVRSRAGMSLWRVPQATVVLELLQSKVVENTTANFPIHRKLLVQEKLKETQTENLISNCVEDLEPCQPDIYDPAFMVPLLSHIMAPESVVQDHKFSRSGALALILMALGSECEYMRTAALTVLSRYHARLDTNNPNARLHEQYIETIRAGIGDLKSHVNHTVTRTGDKPKSSTIVETPGTEDSMASNENASSQMQLAPKVPNLSAAFLARASMVLTHPLHTLYRPLHKFILAKPALDLRTIPELLALLRPGTVDYRVYQEWLLETAQYGMRTAEDVNIAKGCHLFKMLFTLFSSSLSSPHIRARVLRLVEAVQCAPTGTATLLKCGVLPWLHAAFAKLQEKEEQDGSLTITFMRVVFSLKDYAPSLLTMVVPLLLKLPPVVEMSDVQFILQVAHAVIRLISQDHLIVLLHLCQGVMDHKVLEECYMQLGISEEVNVIKLRMVESEQTPVRNEATVNSVDRTELSDLLRNVVVRWSIHHTGPVEDMD